MTVALAAPLEVPLTLAAQIRPLCLLPVEAGPSVLGLPADEPDADPEEARVRSTLTRAFWLGQTPVTVGQWRALELDLAPELDERTAPNTPITYVTWEGARRFCERLPADAAPPGYRFDLPTEQQWEHACRAGTTGRYFFGDDDADLSRYAVFGDTAASGPRVVGSKLPNPFGLFDMLGNVAEWCCDVPADYEDPSVDRRAEGPGTLRCTRGGTFRSGADEGQFLSGRRGWMDANQCTPFQGFRVACVWAP